MKFLLCDFLFFSSSLLSSGSIPFPFIFIRCIWTKFICWHLPSFGVRVQFAVIIIEKCYYDLFRIVLIFVLFHSIFHCLPIWYRNSWLWHTRHEIPLATMLSEMIFFALVNKSTLNVWIVYVKMESFSFQLNKLWYYLLENNKAQRERKGRAAYSLIHFFGCDSEYERFKGFSILGPINKRKIFCITRIRNIEHGLGVQRSTFNV